MQESIREIVNLYVQNDIARKAASDSLIRLASRVEEYCKSTGNLFAICLPKRKIDDYVWRSHPYGIPCYCHPFSSPATP